jgi:hypothetical protein
MTMAAASPRAASRAPRSSSTRKRAALRAWAICALLALLAWLPGAAVAGGAPSSVALTSSANPAVFGQLVFLTASVSSTDGTTPSGQVTFYDGADEILTLDLDADGSGILLITSTMAPGAHPVTARYAGDGTHAAATSEVLVQVITPPASLTSLTSSLNPSIARQAVTLTASVASGHWQAPTPTGTVTFLDGDTPLGSATLDGSARATLTTTALEAGSHAITAAYAGDSGNLASTSAVLTQTVEPASVDVAVTLGTDAPPACGASADLAVVAGTPVNYCFTVTNHTAHTLRYHTLSSSRYAMTETQNGDPFLDVLFELEVAPGASAHYNKVVTAGEASELRFSWTAQAAPPAYAIDDGAALDYVDVGATGVFVEGSAYVPLPFEFTLYGRTFSGGAVDALCVYNNGAAQFVTHPEQCGGNFPLFGSDDWFPPPPDANDSLLPHWDRLGSAGSVQYATVGTAPNRRFVVEWRGKNHADEETLGLGCDAAPADCGITFELILDEAGGTVSFSYVDVEFDTKGGDVLNIDHGASAGVALIDTYRGLRQEYSVGQPALADGRTVRWTPQHAPYVSHAQSRLEVGTPRIAATPSTIAATAAPDEVLIRQLGIRNDGTHALEWSLGRVASDAHFPHLPRHVTPFGDPQHTSLAQPSAGAGGARVPVDPSSVPQPSGVFGLPAYGVKTEPGRFIELVGFDAADPGPFVRVGITQDTLAGDFVGNDFSREYVITQCLSTAEECFDTIDTATGQLGEIAVIRTPDSSQGWTGMAWDESTGTLFASASTCGRTGENRSFLHRIDPATGIPSAVAEIDTGAAVCIADVAIAPNGLMYGLDLYNDALVAIDKDSGAAQAIGSVGFDANYRQSMDFDDASGVLYLAGSSDPLPPLTAMYTLDLATGAATRTGRFDYGYPGTWMTLAGLAIATPGGACARPGEVPWLFYDQVGGTTAPGAESTARVVLDATGLEAGRYSAQLCVHSNDPARSMLQVPVELVVEDAGDSLFADGFDGAP